MTIVDVATEAVVEHLLPRDKLCLLDEMLRTTPSSSGSAIQSIHHNKFPLGVDSIHGNDWIGMVTKLLDHAEKVSAIAKSTMVTLFAADVYRVVFKEHRKESKMLIDAALQGSLSQVLEKEMTRNKSSLSWNLEMLQVVRTAVVEFQNRWPESFRKRTMKGYGGSWWTHVWFHVTVTTLLWL